uniref:Retrovirus-related Pol polyprotein from transposon TNT 1-94 n=1 Tax=Tanacetum cinerariifolium TaxID=118510 RepID=A0A6L2MAN2_TANCI|nr:retrovirus-related Pol polyprotein from transposon TNT 1-94 [Tanacetum cinerariifolium]
MHNSSQGKQQEVEDQRRSVKLSKNKTSVTACNDSLIAKTLNVNSVSAICDKCVLHDKHNMYVLNSVAKAIKKIVALESNQKPRNFTRKLYERVSKTCSWWYSKFTPSGYKWKPKSGKENVNSNLVEIVLFIVDSGCSKHMTGNLKLLINFVEKFLGTNDIVVGLPKLKFVKDHLCSSCKLGKAKRKSFYTKTTPSSKRRLQLLHMDLCGPMRVASINGKRYVLVIVDDYSRYTWTHFLRSKDETPEFLINFLRLVQRGLQAQDRVVRTDKGTEFLNLTFHAFFAPEGIIYQTSVARTPKQNGVVERSNHTLVEAARTMLSAAKVPLFFWAEAIATACFTQNHSLVIPRHEKTPYHIINDRKPSVKFFHIFGSICYIVRDGANLDKIKEKDHISSDPAPECQDNVTQADKTVTTSNELDLLFSPMFDELLNGSSKVVSKSSDVSAADA